MHKYFANCEPAKYSSGVPLPRFERLPIESRSAIVRVAAAEFAAHGRDAASLVTIADRAQLSRSAFYNYFDGKDDVFNTVRRDVVGRLAAVLGEWREAANAAEWWANFESAHDRLVWSLTSNPTDVAFLRNTAPPIELEPWFRAAFADAVRLGLVDTGPGREIVEAATLASLSAVDALALENPASVSFSDLRVILERVWGRATTA